MTTLRNLIHHKMADHHRGDIPGRYWYPLSMATYGVEEVLAVVDCLTEFRTTMGRETEAFEAAFAHRVGADHAVMVNSGSSADLLVALSVGGITRTVAVPAVTWPTHAWSWLMAGHEVVLVDVDPGTLNVDPNALDKLQAEEDINTLSIVHLMGNPSYTGDGALDLYEDCCQALGADVGTTGIAATWSFYFSHHMTTLEGGCITTNDGSLAEHLRLLRAHGWARNMHHPPPVPKDLDPRYAFLDWGLNVRPTELAAAFGLVQLGRLEELNSNRRANYERFADCLGKTRAVRLPETQGQTSPFAIALMARGRDRICAHLEEHGVETRRIAAGNLARHPAARRHHLYHGALPGADEVHDHGFVVGLHPVIDPQAMSTIAELIKEAA